MIDQRVSEGIDSKFFGINAYTTTIPAQFVKKFGCIIQPVYIQRVNKINFKVLFDDQLNFGKNEDVETITAKVKYLVREKL